MKTEQEIKEKLDYLKNNRPEGLKNPKDLASFIKGLEWVLK